MHSNRTARLLLHDPQPIGLHPPHFRGEGAVRRQQPQLLDLHLPQSHQAQRVSHQRPNIPPSREGSR